MPGTPTPAESASADGQGVDWQQLRGQFPSVERCVWLNTATFGQVPLRAQAAIQAHYERRNLHGPRDFLNWFGETDVIREDIARLFEVTADDVAFIPHTSAALSLLVNAIDWQPGDEVLTFENEFPNQIYAPMLLQERGVRVRVIPLEALPESLSPRTRLVTLSQTNYATGEEAPLPAIYEALRGSSALLYVDGTQTAGARRVSFAQDVPDLYAVNAYKWLNAPPGAAFMIVPARTRTWLAPQTIGWRSHFDWRAVNHLHTGRPELADSAERYEGGMLPFVNLFALRESVRIVLEAGIDAVEARVLSLARMAAQELLACGATLAGNRAAGSSHIVAARLPNGIEPGALAKQLEAEDVLVSARHGFLRVSPHFYNTPEDIARFASLLRRALHHA
jgi:cysteine desulfurase / selenocysteine lyase